MKLKTKEVTLTGITMALSYIIARMTSFPVFPSAPYLKLHFGEVPLLLLTVCISLELGLIALFGKEILSFILSGSNILGLIADFVLVAAFLFVTAIILKKTKKRTVNVMTAAFCGAVIRALLAIPVNIVILRFQYGTPVAGVLAQLVWIIPFNFLKSFLDMVCVALLYERLKTPMQKALYG